MSPVWCGGRAMCFAAAVRFVEDVSRGEWIRPRLTGWGAVSSIVPVGFAAYARILHPVSLSVVVDVPGGRDRVERPATWASIAERLGATAHAAMQWGAITGGDEGSTWIDGWEVDPPRVGELDQEVLSVLAAVLPPGPCTVGVWSGRGGLTGGVRVTFSTDPGFEGKTESGPFGVDPAITRAVLDGPLLDLPGRHYVLLAGETEELIEPGWASGAGLGDPGFAESLNLLWPDDRSWFVATEIDFDSTIVGGSAELIDRILRAPGLEAVPVTPETDLSSEGDPLNG